CALLWRTRSFNHLLHCATFVVYSIFDLPLTELRQLIKDIFTRCVVVEDEHIAIRFLNSKAIHWLDYVGDIVASNTVNNLISYLNHARLTNNIFPCCATKSLNVLSGGTVRVRGLVEREGHQH